MRKIRLIANWKITIFNGKIQYKWQFSIAFCMFTRGYVAGQCSNLICLFFEIAILGHSNPKKHGVVWLIIHQASLTNWMPNISQYCGWLRNPAPVDCWFIRPISHCRVSTILLVVQDFSTICGYGSIPINTIFRGMNIHLPAILMFTRGIGFWPIPMFHGLPPLFGGEFSLIINHHIGPRGCLVQLLDLTLYQSVLLRRGRWEMGMGDGSGYIPHII